MEVRAAEEEDDSPDLNGFLEWLEEHSKGATDPYRDLFDRLVSFFQARDRPDADECADATLHVAAFRYRPADRKAYDHPRKYVLGVARNVNYEMFRRARRFAALEERLAKATPPAVDEETESELMRECVRVFGRDKVIAVMAYDENKRKGQAADVKTRVAMSRLKGKMKRWIEERLT